MSSLDLTGFLEVEIEVSPAVKQNLSTNSPFFTEALDLAGLRHTCSLALHFIIIVVVTVKSSMKSTKMVHLVIIPFSGQWPLNSTLLGSRYPLCFSDVQKSSLSSR